MSGPRPIRPIQPTAAAVQEAPTITFKPSIIPRGDGSFLVTAGKPIHQPVEIGTREVSKILGVCRAQVWYLRETRLGQEYLRWRFISPKQGNILWERESVLRFKEALRQLGK